MAQAFRAGTQLGTGIKFKMSYDAIIVLGRGISEGGVLPKISLESVYKAKELLLQGLAPRIIFCGKWSRHYNFVPKRTEANAMKALALEIGTPEDQIFIEDQSLDTISNLYYAKKKYLIPNNWRKVLLLTLHKNDKRALLMAEYILGPDYTIAGHSIDFEFPEDKADYILNTEKQKVRMLKEFMQNNNIKPGNHELLFKEHLRFIKEHDIKPTFKEK